MTPPDVIGLVLCVLLLWVCKRAADKPRTTPKIPRDRSRDSRWIFFVGF